MNILPISRRDARFLAATVHYEAGGEPREGMAAVAQVILNRAQDGRGGWVGPGAGPVERVCLAPWQFSCWNGRENRRARLRALFVDGNPDKGWINETVARASRDAVRAFLSGNLSADVLSCSHYINVETAPDVGSALTGWATRWREGVHIGRHTFLRPDQLTPPERPVSPVHVATPVIDKRRVGALVRWARQYGRRAWSTLTGAFGLIAGALMSAYGEVVAVFRGAGVRFDDLFPPDMPSLQTFLIIAAILGVAALAIIFYQNRKERTDENPYRTPPGRTVDSDRGARAGDHNPRSDSGRGGGQHSHPPRFGGIDKALLGRLQRGA